MRAVTAQRLAAACALPFYVFLLPLGLAIHFIFGSVALVWSQYKLGEAIAPNPLVTLHRWKSYLYVFPILWLLAPALTGLAMSKSSSTLATFCPGAPSLASAAVLSTIADHAAIYAQLLGADESCRYTIGQFVLVLFPAIALLIAPQAALFAALSVIVARKINTDKKLGLFERVRSTAGYSLLIIGPAVIYIGPVSVTHDAGIGPFDVSRGFTGAPLNFFLLHWGSFLSQAVALNLAAAPLLARLVQLPPAVESGFRSLREIRKSELK